MLQRTALFLCLLFSAIHSSASSYLVFGDSLSDVGNAYALTNQTYPAAPNDAGRFSNGPLWVEYLQGSALNYAYIGASSGVENILDDDHPELEGTGLLAQIDEYMNNDYDPSALTASQVYILIGGNDFYALIEEETMFMDKTVTDSAISDIVDNIVEAVQRLQTAGAKNIVVLNLPNLGVIPLVQDYPAWQRRLMTATTNRFNSLLKTAAGDYRFGYYDLNTQTQKIIDKPSKYGIKNVNDACFNEVTQIVCSNPDEYFFWDRVHPTAKVHQMIGNLFVTP